MSNPVGGPSPRKLFSSGSLLIIGFGVFLVGGWYAYRQFIPPVWLHDFGADIALRAEADPNAALPEDSRQSSPRGLANSPYICVAKIVPQPWDRLIAVAASQDPRAVPALSQAKWSEGALEDLATRMSKDPRYQLLVLLKGGTVVDAQMFYIFWATLDGIARPEGFTPEQAIFTAASKDSVYVLTQAVDAPPDACK